MPKTVNLLSVVEVADQLNIGRRAVVDLIRTHRLPAKKLPGRTGAYVLTPEDVEAYRRTLRDEQDRAAS